jgi:dimethylargininase
MLSSEADKLTRVIVSSPKEEYYKLDNLKAHNILEVADREIAMAQHDHLKTILSDFGAEVIDLPELLNHPNSVFTRDTALCTPGGYIELVPGIDTREDEGTWMASALDQIGEPCVGKVRSPGSVDGGDVVLFNDIAFIGLSGRTNKEGARQLSDILKPMGYEVHQVPLPDSILHLDKVLMPVNPQKLIVCKNIVTRTLLEGLEFTPIEFSEFSTANIICLGDNKVIVGESNTGALKCLERLDVNIHKLAISEFVKGAGGPNCLIMPVTRIKI